MDERKDIEAARAGRQAGQTAAERCAEQRQDIAVLMDCIRMDLDHYGACAAEDPENWGYAGTLDSIRRSLKDILMMLVGGRHDLTRTEASRFVEDHLESMREDRNRKEE